MNANAVRIPLIVCLCLTAVATLSLAQSPAPAKPSGSPSQLSTADELWAHIQGLRNKQNPDGDGDALIKSIIVLDSAYADFAKRFPDDRRHAQAELEHAVRVATLAGAGIPGYTLENDEGLWKAALADAPEHPPVFKDQALLCLADVQIDLGHLDPLEGEIAELRGKSRSGVFDIDGLELLYAMKLSASDPQKAGAIMQKLTARANAQTAADARASLKINDMLGKPLDLKFTAIDGSDVDLSRLRGKVVLVNFWATWCGPCCGEIPGLKAAYSKYHDKGFEIIGISLDQDRQSLTQFVKENDMKWPQYFDGKGMKNQIGAPYGIDNVPRLWLVDKKGNLVNIDARGTLETDVEKLLAE